MSKDEEGWNSSFGRELALAAIRATAWSLNRRRPLCLAQVELRAAFINSWLWRVESASIRRDSFVTCKDGSRDRFGG